MKYVFTGGKYTQFMGRMFAFGQPVDVNDPATLRALEGRRDFAVYQENQPENEVTKEAKKYTEVVNVDACPKCGKILSRGKYMHVKFCKGKQ